MMSWFIYIAIVGYLFYSQHYIWGFVIGFIGFFYCIARNVESSENESKNPTLKQDSKRNKKDVYNKHRRSQDQEDHLEYEHKTLARKRNSSTSRKNEKMERDKLEEEAYLLRKHNSEHWKVKEIDDQLGRSVIEREWENTKYDYEPVCHSCNQWESK